LRLVVAADEGDGPAVEPGLSPAAVAGHSCGRWNIETAFPEARSGPGPEATRGRCRQAVLRAAPCLLGLYTVVALRFDIPPAGQRARAVAWPGKATVTFADARSGVRRWRSAEAVLPQAGDATAPQKLPKRVRELLLPTLATAA